MIGKYAQKNNVLPRHTNSNKSDSFQIKLICLTINPLCCLSTPSPPHPPKKKEKKEEKKDILNFLLANTNVEKPRHLYFFFF